MRLCHPNLTMPVRRPDTMKEFLRLARLFLFLAMAPALPAQNPAKVVIIKADDYKSFAVGWTNFLQVNRVLGVKAGIGVICTNMAGNTNIAQWMQAQEKLGDVEFWDHGWDHTQWTNTGGLLVSAFKDSGLPFMQSHLELAQNALSNALGHAVSVFGSGYNGFDTNTAAALNATPAMRLLFAPSPTTAKLYLVPRVAAVKIISELATGQPSFTNFIALYPSGPTGPVALQFHPLGFGAAGLLEYQKIIQFLQSNSYSILLPAEYIAALPFVTNSPASQSVRVGSNVTFTVGGTGAATLAYQWLFNGVKRTGAIAATLTLTNVQTTNAGNFAVVITNAFGSVTSSPAMLTVTNPPLALTFTGTNGAAGFGGGPFSFWITGPPGSNVVIAASTDLQTWIPLTTNPLGAGFTFTDALATNYLRRFYRATLQP